MRYSSVVDGRNVLSPEEGRNLDFNNLSIGKPDVIPNEVNRYTNAEAVA